jgi:hypothetical protein
LKDALGAPENLNDHVKGIRVEHVAARIQKPEHETHRRFVFLQHRPHPLQDEMEVIALVQLVRPVGLSRSASSK